MVQVTPKTDLALALPRRLMMVSGSETGQTTPQRALPSSDSQVGQDDKRINGKNSQNPQQTLRIIRNEVPINMWSSPHFESFLVFTH